MDDDQKKKNDAFAHSDGISHHEIFFIFIFGQKSRKKKISNPPLVLCFDATRGGVG